MRNCTERWYDRLPSASDLQVRSDFAGWLKTLPWQLYTTLTFAYERSNASADRVLREYLNYVEKSMHAPVSCFIGKECDPANKKRWSGCGMPASPVHFHLLMGSAVPLDSGHIRKTWHRYGGRGKYQDSADVRPYDPEYELHHAAASINAADYVTKYMVHPEWHWREHRLELMVPDRPESYKTSARMRRLITRNEERKSVAIR